MRQRLSRSTGVRKQPTLVDEAEVVRHHQNLGEAIPRSQFVRRGCLCFGEESQCELLFVRGRLSGEGLLVKDANSFGFGACGILAGGGQSSSLFLNERRIHREQRLLRHRGLWSFRRSAVGVREVERPENPRKSLRLMNA